MVRSIRFAVALGLLSGAVAAQAQIDLTPKDSFYEVEGIRVPNVTFHEKTKPISYTPPANWTLVGGGNKLTLTPKDAVQAGATIETVAAQAPIPGAGSESVKSYTEMVLGMVPKEATKVEVVEAVMCPMRISGKAMIEVTVAYSFFGQPFRMNVLIMPRETELLRFQFLARSSDYPALFKNFRGSLFSMQGL